MMDEQQRMILAIAARLLSYPGEQFLLEQMEIGECIREDFAPGELRRALSAAVSPFLALSVTEARECYVATFDWKETAGLYLTAQELGDSRKRGVALVELQNLVLASGFTWPDGELADYMPMLYELLAAAPESEPLARLQTRLGLATKRITNYLPEDNMYRALFAVLVRYVFGEPSPAELEKLEAERESADLDPLPYPMQYN